VRFDDSLRTVLAADAAPGYGAQAAWRQLVDLIGRGRAAADEPAIARLRLLRQAVPVPVRAASARALGFAMPPAPLVGLFAEDELAIAAPVLRTAELTGDEWLALLPRLTPAGRSVLRQRRDLAPDVIRGLASFGSVDFVIDRDPTPPHQRHQPATVMPVEVVSSPPAVAPTTNDDLLELTDAIEVVAPTELAAAPVTATFREERGRPLGEANGVEPAEPVPSTGTFEIAELVARIEAFNRSRPEPGDAATRVEPGTFRYEADATGMIRWVDGVARAPLIGVSLTHAALQGLVQIDGVATGAFRRRSGFSDARLQVGGNSEAAGGWRLSGVPVFDHATGRFTGFRGTGRRPRADETAEPLRQARAASDSLRQLVHELRTPTNAIAGFAELIETELLGPVAGTYRDRAATIRAQAASLLAAIEDLDTAARIEGHALELRPGPLVLEPLIDRLLADLDPLVRLRGAATRFDGTGETVVEADDRAVERLIGRLLSVLIAAATRDERVGIAVTTEAGFATVTFDRPRALGARDGGALLSIDAEAEGGEGLPLLGTGFALRLARNLAAELGGSLAIDEGCLTLRLPTAVDQDVGQAIN